MKVSVGDPAPEFTLQDQTGTKWSLADHRGSPVVLYFYPKDDTPGCTSQASDIRDNWDAFSEHGAHVVGISPDDVHSHTAFADKYNLPHRLLADPDHSVLEAYGAWGERSVYGKTFMGVIRSSVVVDAQGRVAAVFDKIKPEQQAERALATLDALRSA